MHIIIMARTRMRAIAQKRPYEFIPSDTHPGPSHWAPVVYAAVIALEFISTADSRQPCDVRVFITFRQHI